MLPNVPIASVAAPTSADLTVSTNLYPLVTPIVKSDAVDAVVANQQPRAIERRTETLRATLNKVIQTINAIKTEFLLADGVAAGSVMRGDLSLYNPTTSTRSRVRNIADGVDPHDGASLQQVQAVVASIAAVAAQLSAFLKTDGSNEMAAPLNMGGHRVINVGDPVNFTDLVNRRYFDNTLAPWVDSFLPRNGSRPMTADLNMDGHRIFGLPTAGYPQNGSDAATKAFVDGLASATTSAPPGFIGFYAGDTVPAGWLLANGALYNKSTYPSLWNALQNRYGGTDPTFAVPDIRGRVIVGLDNLGGTSANVINNPLADILGGKFGTETVALEINQIPAHAHAFQDAYFQAGSGSGYFGPASTDADNALTEITKQTSFTGEGAPHNNCQPTIALLCIIKT